MRRKFGPANEYGILNSEYGSRTRQPAGFIRHSVFHIRRSLLIPSSTGARKSTRSGGMVLVVVVVVISLLALGALTFSELMMAEREGAEVAVAQSQARALAESGAEMARFFLAQDAETQTQAGGWYDNSQKLRGIAVTNEGGVRGTGRFTLIAPSVGSDGRLSGIRFGLEDESARLNLNTVLTIDKANEGKNLGRQMLMALPGMREDIADAILDWIDLDDESREYGAEIDTYASLSPPYAARNGVPDTLEELLLVRDVTPALFFGYDMNRNYLVDRSESNAPIVLDADNSDGAMNCGWSAYLTASSKESNLRADGEAKIDLSQSNLQQLREDLSSVLDAEWADFIVAYRLSTSNGYGTVSSRGGAKVSPSSALEGLDLSSESAKTSLTSVLDLIEADATKAVTCNSKTVESPFPEALATSFLPKLMENCTVGSSGATGRVNINLASRVVLSAILSADTSLAEDTSQIEELVDQIVSERPQDPTQADEEFKYETWIYTRGMVKLDQMKKLIPYVCAGGAVYRTQTVGYYDKGGPSARIEVVIDATSSPPAIVFWREMTHLGRGYPLETLGIEAEEP